MDLNTELQKLAADYARHCAGAPVNPAATFGWLQYWPTVRQMLDILLSQSMPLAQVEKPKAT